MHERTEELTRLNAALARAKGEADAANISKTKFLAAASHDILQPLNAARLYVTSLIERQAAKRRPPAGRQHRRLARGGGGNLRRAARHVAARHRRDAAGIRQLPHRRTDAPDRARIRAARRRQGARPRLHAVLAGGALRPPAAAPADAEPGLQRHQIHAVGPRAGRLPAAAATICASTSTTPASAFRSRKQRDIFVEFHRLDQGARIARGLGLGLSIVERIARVLGCEVEVDSSVGNGSRFSVDGAAVECGAGRAAGARRARASIPASSPAPPRSASTTSPSVLDGMETLLHGWGCEVIKAPDLDGALAAIAERAAVPNGLLVDYHLDRGNGIEAIVALRARLRRAAGDPDHRRPLAGGARAGARAQASRCCTSRSSRRRCARCWRNGACCAWWRRSSRRPAKRDPYAVPYR